MIIHKTRETLGGSGPVVHGHPVPGWPALPASTRDQALRAQSTSGTGKRRSGCGCLLSVAPRCAPTSRSISYIWKFPWPWGYPQFAGWFLLKKSHYYEWMFWLGVPRHDETETTSHFWLGVPPNGWFIRENPIRMDDLGGTPMTQETTISNWNKLGKTIS